MLGTPDLVCCLARKSSTDERRHILASLTELVHVCIAATSALCYTWYTWYTWYVRMYCCLFVICLCVRVLTLNTAVRMSWILALILYIVVVLLHALGK